METSNKEERTWALIAHLSAFAMYLTAVGHLVGPLIVWLVKGKESAFINEHAKEALNFQITITIIGIVAIIMCFTVILAVIGIPILIALGLYQIVCMIIAAIKANEGVLYRYPLTLRLIS